MPRKKVIPPDHERCLHANSVGYRCRRLRLPSDETYQHTLCFVHYNRQVRSSQPSPAIPLSARPDVVAFRLLPPDTSLNNAEAVNLLLTRVFREVAEGHLSTKQASTLAYLGQLILATLPHLHREAAAAPPHPILQGDPDAALVSMTQALQSFLVPNPSSAPPVAASPHPGGDDSVNLRESAVAVSPETLPPSPASLQSSVRLPEAAQSDLTPEPAIASLGGHGPARSACPEQGRRVARSDTQEGELPPISEAHSLGEER